MTLLLVSGSVRRASTNTAAVRTAAQLIDDACVLDVLGRLPHFDPGADHDPLPGTVAELRSQVAGAEALLICTPEYAGTLPGSFKNLLDWLVGGTEMSGKPTAWITVAEGDRGNGAAATLATVLGYVGARIVHEACARIPVRRDAVTADGLITDPGIRAALAQVLATLREGAAGVSAGREETGRPSVGVQR